MTPEKTIVALTRLASMVESGRIGKKEMMRHLGLIAASVRLAAANVTPASVPIAVLCLEDGEHSVEFTLEFNTEEEFQDIISRLAAFPHGVATLTPVDVHPDGGRLLLDDARGYLNGETDPWSGRPVHALVKKFL